VKRQWRLVQGKSRWEKQKEEEAKEEAGKKREEKEKTKKQKKRKTVEVKKVTEEWEIWDEGEEAAKSEAEAKKMVPEKYYQYVTNFIQLVSPQPVDRFSQTKLHWKAPNEGYLHICGMYKSDNK